MIVLNHSMNDDDDDDDDLRRGEGKKKGRWEKETIKEKKRRI